MLDGLRYVGRPAQGGELWRLGWSQGAVLLVEPARDEASAGTISPVIEAQIEAAKATTRREVLSWPFVRALMRARGSDDVVRVLDGDVVATVDPNLVAAVVARMPAASVLGMGVIRGQDTQAKRSERVAMSGLVIMVEDEARQWWAIVLSHDPRRLSRVATRSLHLGQNLDLEDDLEGMRKVLDELRATTPAGGGL